MSRQKPKGPIPKEEKKFPCPDEDCLSGFSRRDDLKTHVAAKHEKGLSMDRRGNDILVEGDPETIDRAKLKHGYTPASRWRRHAITDPSGVQEKTEEA
jgi:hypothetical protein